MLSTCKEERRLRHPGMAHYPKVGADALLNAKSDTIDPDIIPGFRQRPSPARPGLESTEDEISAALKIDGKRENSGTK